ncbi:MAG: hypothetical protein AAGD32_07985 [Planctomycetota bacterium]
MQPLDYTILVGYLLGLLLIGATLAKRAAAGGDSYFLANRKTPWWALGASGMSSNLDVAGTVVIITLIYTYGLQGFWIETRGGVVLPIAVWLAFMGKWHRRSKVTTTAEWMELRFGDGAAGKAARITAALTYLVITVAMVTFFLSAAAKFIAQFTPLTPEWAAVLMALVALAYTLAAGLYGVIWTDVFQAFLIGGAAIFISVKAFGVVTPELLESWPGAATNTAWPQLSLDDETFGSMFWLFLIFFIGKGLLEGLGGSGGSAYMAQRYYAAGSDKDTVKMSALWVILFSFRWPMVLGLAVLALNAGIGEDDPENILAALLTGDEVFPTGIRGLIIAALFAASMSTFDSTINAGASYVVKDVWNPLRGSGLRNDRIGYGGHGGSFGRKNAKEEVYVGYAASAGIVVLGLVIYFAIARQSDILAVWTNIVVALFPAFLVPFALRWFWARFNGVGFVLGIIGGFGATLVTFYQEAFSLTLNDWQTIAFIAGISVAFSILGTLITEPVAKSTLRSFHRQIRPWGLWPREFAKPGDDTMAVRDIVRLIVAVLWQLSTFLLPMLAVIHQWEQLIAVAIVWSVLSVYLIWDIATMRDLVD